MNRGKYTIKLNAILNNYTTIKDLCFNSQTVNQLKDTMTIKKIYSSSFAPNPLRVNYMLKLKGIDIELIDIDLTKGEQLSPDFIAINPEATIPVMLLNDGTTLCDTIGMLHYIEKSYPETPLMGDTIIEQAQVISMMHRIYTKGLLSIADVLRNGAIPGFEGRGLPGTEPVEQIPALMERGTKRLDSFYKSINQSLQGNDYLVANKLSQADVDLYVCCNFAAFIEQAFKPEELGNLAAHHQRMSSLIGT